MNGWMGENLNCECNWDANCARVFGIYAQTFIVAVYFPSIILLLRIPTTKRTLVCVGRPLCADMWATHTLDVIGEEVILAGKYTTLGMGTC